jgi:hypothetical protein
MSQDPDTKSYILVQNNSLFINWISGNEKIDNFIQKMKLKSVDYDDIVFEWIPYSQFYNIKKTDKNNLYLATWKNGPLRYYNSNIGYKRIQDVRAALYLLYNSQSAISEFINSVIIYKVCRNF